jgi:hypothetical protein
MTERLNPKLTKRNLASNLPSGEEEKKGSPSKAASSAGSEGSDYTGTETGSEITDDSFFANQPKVINPRLHLLHNGAWIPKQVSSLHL